MECAITSVSVDLRRSDLGVSIYELQIRIMSSDTFKTLVAQVENSNNLFEIILLLIVVMFLSWIGIGYPLNALSNSAVNTAAMANLNYALKHGSAWDVPHKFLGSSLVYPYALDGRSQCWSCFDNNYSACT